MHWRQTSGKSGCRHPANRTQHRASFNIALNYGGRAEIVDAARRAIAAGIPAESLDEQCFARYLYTAGQPDPDLLIRTSGEMRVSNFLLADCVLGDLGHRDAVAWISAGATCSKPSSRTRSASDAKGGIKASPVALGARDRRAAIVSACM